MNRPRALVLRTAGTNCEAETVRALEAAGAASDLFHIERLLSEPRALETYQILVVPGGFSYGDDVAAGRVFGLELKRHMARELKAFVARGGMALGVCNGFQILVEAGLLDAGSAAGDAGSEPGQRDFALYANASNHYECRWVTLEEQDCTCTWLVPGLRAPVPVAHAEGRFVVRDEAALERLIQRGQVALRYVRADGGPAEYPENPNGSAYDIAGICDPTGRVLGLMPHPERNLTPWNHPYWTRLGTRSEGEGLNFYRRMVEAASGAPV